jgi:hypothetical protein
MKFATKGTSHPAYFLKIETAFSTNSLLKVALGGIGRSAIP